MKHQGKETRFSRSKKLLKNTPLEDKNSKTSDKSETLKTVVTPHSKTREEKSDGNSSDDSKKVGSKVDIKELTTIVIDIVERYTRPTSKIVLKDSSASDITPNTAALEVKAEIQRKCQKGYDT